MSEFITSLLRRTPAVASIADADKSKHLGWLMLTALGIGATIGAGIFVMPGRIAQLAGPAGILSFVITGFVFLFVGICYERFARVVPHGVSAYSYVYHSMGELFAWIVAFGLFLEYSFGASAVAVGWSVYLNRVVKIDLPSFFKGPVINHRELNLGRELGSFNLVSRADNDAAVANVAPVKDKEVPLLTDAAGKPLGGAVLGFDSRGLFVSDHKDSDVLQVNETKLKKDAKAYVNPYDTVIAGGQVFNLHRLERADATTQVACRIESVEGKKLEEGKPFLIGAGEESTSEKIVLNDETVSGKHAQIEQDASGITYITDLGSTNGTFVDGVKLKPNERTKVSPNSKVRLGNKEDFQFGINVVALGVVAVVTAILIGGGVQKSAKLNFFLVCLKSLLLVVFMVAGIKHIDPANWQPFMPKGWEGVLQGAAIAVFPYVGFDALYTFARESKSAKDTRIATYWCIGLVAFLYVAVMAIATAIAPVFPNGPDADPNTLFVGTEASAPLANLLIASGENWAGTMIAAGAVIGIFNVLLVLSMGGPRIFRNMAEDGLLPPIFAKTSKGNPTFGLLVNGVVVGAVAGFVPFDAVTDIMVLGTLVAFIFVCIGAARLKLVPLIVSIAGAGGCLLLSLNLGDLVWKVYSVTCPVGLAVYFLYSRHHSKLGKAEN